MFLKRAVGCMCFMFCSYFTASAQRVGQAGASGSGTTAENQRDLFRHPQDDQEADERNSLFESRNRIGAKPDPLSNAEGASTPGTVSTVELRHPPSRAEGTALQRAQRYSAMGEHVKAIQILEKALFPASATMPYARSLLGVEYLKIGNLRAAVVHLKEAVVLLPSLAANHSNLGYVLCRIGNRQAGEQELREAIMMDRNSSRSQFVLGILLMDSDTSEARDHLQLARNEVAMARLALAVYYARLGEDGVAHKELEGYLQMNPRVDWAGANRWVAHTAILSNPASAFGFPTSMEQLTSGN